MKIQYSILDFHGPAALAQYVGGPLSGPAGVGVRRTVDGPIQDHGNGANLTKIGAQMETKLVRVALPPSVATGPGRGGLPCVRVKSTHGAAQIYFHGAHLTSWEPAVADAPVIWLSRESLFEPGQPIRGGVPVCFPWFSAHRSDRTAPNHGFARLRDWTLVAAAEHADGQVELAFELASESPVSPAWPHAFAVTHRITIGPALILALDVRNPGPEPFTYEEALHTYFAVQDVRQISITGLEETEYRDAVSRSRGRQDREPIRFASETDRVYLNTQATCVIHDPGKRRRIVNRKTGSDSTVVWNPWIDKARALPDFGDLEWPEMVCIETGNVREHARTLVPGETHTMAATIESLPL
jgi:glucose-6-phosphate 1-epimerase